MTDDFVEPAGWDEKPERTPKVLYSGNQEEPEEFEDDEIYSYCDECGEEIDNCVCDDDEEDFDDEDDE